MIEDTHDPGTEEAIEAGCTCPVADNGHGSGYMGQAGMFVYSMGCPLHWDERRETPRGAMFPE